MSTCRLVVFDIAGTTVKDSGHVARAFAAALADQGVVVSPQQLAAVRGSSKREAIAELLGTTGEARRRADAAYAAFIDHLTRAYRRHGVLPIDGADEAFRRLRDAGLRVALNTGFDRAMTGRLLDALEWSNGIVDAIVCGDDVRRGRPAPFMIFHAMELTGVTSVREVATVGDTALDLQAGDNAGVQWNIGVLTGAHGRPELVDAPHTHIVESVAAVPRVVLSARG